MNKHDEEQYQILLANFMRVNQERDELLQRNQRVAQERDELLQRIDEAQRLQDFEVQRVAQERDELLQRMDEAQRLQYFEVQRLAQERDELLQINQELYRDDYFHSLENYDLVKLQEFKFPHVPTDLYTRIQSDRTSGVQNYEVASSVPSTKKNFQIPINSINLKKSKIHIFFFTCTKEFCRSVLLSKYLPEYLDNLVKDISLEIDELQKAFYYYGIEKGYRIFEVDKFQPVFTKFMDSFLKSISSNQIALAANNEKLLVHCVTGTKTKTELQGYADLFLFEEKEKDGRRNCIELKSPFKELRTGTARRNQIFFETQAVAIHNKSILSTGSLKSNNIRSESNDNEIINNDKTNKMIEDTTNKYKTIIKIDNDNNDNNYDANDNDNNNNNNSNNNNNNFNDDLKIETSKKTNNDNNVANNKSINNNMNNPATVGLFTDIFAGCLDVCFIHNDGSICHWFSHRVIESDHLVLMYMLLQFDITIVETDLEKYKDEEGLSTYLEVEKTSALPAPVMPTSSSNAASRINIGVEPNLNENNFKSGKQSRSWNDDDDYYSMKENIINMVRADYEKKGIQFLNPSHFV